jgi:hypothetical protein
MILFDVQVANVLFFDVFRIDYDDVSSDGNLARVAEFCMVVVPEKESEEGKD